MSANLPGRPEEKRDTERDNRKNKKKNRSLWAGKKESKSQQGPDTNSQASANFQLALK